MNRTICIEAMTSGLLWEAWQSPDAGGPSCLHKNKWTALRSLIDLLEQNERDESRGYETLAQRRERNERGRMLHNPED